MLSQSRDKIYFLGVLATHKVGSRRYKKHCNISFPNSQKAVVNILQC